VCECGYECGVFDCLCKIFVEYFCLCVCVWLVYVV